MSEHDAVTLVLKPPRRSPCWPNDASRSSVVGRLAGSALTGPHLHL